MLNNEFFSIRFICDTNSVNWLQITTNYNESSDYYISVSDDKNLMCHTIPVKNNMWYNYDFGYVFKYSIKLLKFGSDKVKIIKNEDFDIRNHNFNIILKSDDSNEIKTWKYYLWLIQLKFDVRFNIIENENIELEGETIEISRAAYQYHLNKFYIQNDYSSSTIIKTLFDVMHENEVKEILNHPWFINIDV
jgi:hypothetical protein